MKKTLFILILAVNFSFAEEILCERKISGVFSALKTYVICYKGNEYLWVQGGIEKTGNKCKCDK